MAFRLIFHALSPVWPLGVNKHDPEKDNRNRLLSFRRIALLDWETSWLLPRRAYRAGALLFGCDGFSATHRNLTKAEQGPITPDMRTSLALHSLTILALLTSHWTLAAEPDKEGFRPYL